MTYAEQTWANDDPTTPLSAARLQHIEDGLAAVVAMRASPASGGNDAPALASLIASAPSGSRVELDPSNGPYLLSSALTWAKPLVIDCRGATLKTNVANLHEWLLVTAGGDGTVIFNGIFDSNTTGRTTIRFVSCTQIAVEGCRFINKAANVQADTAIKFSGCSSARVVGNIFNNWGSAGVETGPLASNQSRCVGTDNTCSDILLSGNDINTVCRFADVVGTDYVITSNRIRHVADNAIYVTSSDTPGTGWRDIVIANNRFDDFEEGIVMAGSNEGTTEWCERVTIAHNIFTNWTLTAVDWDHRVRDITIIGNTFASDSGTGLFIGLRTSHQTDTAITQDIKISNNRFRGACSYSPIWVQDLAGSCSIVNNDFEIDFTISGLRFVKIDGATVDGLFFGGNNMKVNSGSNVTGMWCKATATNCKYAANSLVGASRLFSYGVSATAGTPPGFVSDAAPPPNTQLFTVPGPATWTKSDGATVVHAVAVGGGGGGGSGRTSVSGTIAQGGGGGAGAAWAVSMLLASICGSTETVTVAAGGPGGTTSGADSTNGNPGTGGGFSSFGSKMRANGGSAGGAGVSAPATNSATGANLGGGTSGSGSLTGTAGNSGNTGSAGGGGGGAGGGITTGVVASNGGNGAAAQSNNVSQVVGGAGAGANGNNVSDPSIIYGGSGGAGGASNAAGAGFAGGTGGSYGGGGGGGGASINGTISGVGGAGGPGAVLVVTY